MKRRMQETVNKQKRITLKTLHEMLDGMSVEQTEKVHLLFMANYIDNSDYDFRDENQVESYCWCYRDLFELKTKESQEIVNSQLIEFLDEWRQDAPSRYRKAKDDICYWITDEWYGFESPMQKEIETAYQTALKKFRGFTGYGDTYTKLAIFTEAVVELYCHLRQMPDLSKRMADEMDINLEVFNLETDFFGDLHCSSRFTDMLCDAQAQYGDYSELDMCPMWGMWVKEGRE